MFIYLTSMEMHLLTIWGYAYWRLASMNVDCIRAQNTFDRMVNRNDYSKDPSKI
jgi:hypothetical protein